MPTMILHEEKDVYPGGKLQYSSLWIWREDDGSLSYVVVQDDFAIRALVNEAEARQSAQRYSRAGAADLAARSVYGRRATGLLREIAGSASGERVVPEG